MMTLIRTIHLMILKHPQNRGHLHFAVADGLQEKLMKREFG